VRLIPDIIIVSFPSKLVNGGQKEYAPLSRVSFIFCFSCQTSISCPAEKGRDFQPFPKKHLLFDEYLLTNQHLMCIIVS
jgi:hypothetical protein